MWLVSKKDACQLQIKNIKNKNENITSYRFGVNLNVNVPLFVDVVVVDNLRNFKCFKFWGFKRKNTQLFVSKILNLIVNTICLFRWK